MKDISIYDAKFREESWEDIPLRFQQTEILAIAADGSRLVTSKLSDASLLDGHGSFIKQLCPSNFGAHRTEVFSPDSKLNVLPFQWTSAIHLFDANTSAGLKDICISRWGVFDAEARCLEFSPGSTRLASGHSDRSIQIRSIATSERIAI